MLLDHPESAKFLPANSIKDGERLARGYEKGISISINGDMNLFWSSVENKNQIQKYFMSWMIMHCDCDKQIQSIKLVAGESQQCPQLISTQDEADELIPFHINHGYSKNIKSVLVVSSDTEMFAGLLPENSEIG